jgi:hypothetical protein
VGENRALWQFIQFVVGELPVSCGDVCQDCGDGLFGEPAQRGTGWVGGSQGILQRV